MEAKKDTGGDFIAPGASTGTVTGGGVAPVSGEKIRMRAPDGAIGGVNSSEVLRLKSIGYSVVE